MRCCGTSGGESGSIKLFDGEPRRRCRLSGLCFPHFQPIKWPAICQNGTYLTGCYIWVRVHFRVVFFTNQENTKRSRSKTKISEATPSPGTLLYIDTKQSAVKTMPAFFSVRSNTAVATGIGWCSLKDQLSAQWLTARCGGLGCLKEEYAGCAAAKTTKRTPDENK